MAGAPRLSNPGATTGRQMGVACMARILHVKRGQCVASRRGKGHASCVPVGQSAHHCSGQVKMDTQLSHPCQRLIFIRTAIAQRGVLPSAVVEYGWNVSLKILEPLERVLDWEEEEG
jgi:hypothetical protein